MKLATRLLAVSMFAWASLPPAAQESTTRELAEALADGQVELTTEGYGIRAVRVSLRSVAGTDLRVRIPAGTYFLSADASVQNMVALGDTVLELRGGSWSSDTVLVACANRTRKIPGEDARFSVAAAGERPELERLARFIGEEAPDWKAGQAAVWIVTDDATDGEIAALVTRRPGDSSGGDRTIGILHTIEGLRLCDRAGVELAQRAIWGERWELYSHARAHGRSDLVTWFESHAVDFDSTLATLDAEDPELRRQGLLALARIADRRALDPTIAALGDPKPTVRNRAAHVLQFYAAPSSIEPLCRSLEDASHGVRRTAAATLGVLGDPRAIEPLVRLLGAEEPEAAHGALIALSTPDATPVLEGIQRTYADLEPRARAISLDILSRHPDRRAAGMFLAGLIDSHAEVRQAAANFAKVFRGELHDERIVDALMIVAKQPRLDPRRAAVGSLGIIGDPRCVDLLLEVAQVPDQELLATTVWALAKFDDPRILPVLEEALTDDSLWVRQSAASGLGLFGDPAAVAALLRAFSDESSQVRRAAAEAVIELAGRDAVDPLIGLLEDVELPSHAHNEARRTLHSLTGQAHGLDPAAWRAWQRGS